MKGVSSHLNDVDLGFWMNFDKFPFENNRIIPNIDDKEFIKSSFVFINNYHSSYGKFKNNKRLKCTKIISHLNVDRWTLVEKGWVCLHKQIK